MEASLIIGILLVVGVLIYQFGTLPKTVSLITRIAPYEQVGGGKGSLLVIGDSTGYGTGASSDTESIAGLIGGDFPFYTIDNNSENGRKISGAIAVAQNLTESYDVILLQVGANDLLADRGVDEVVADMNKLILLAQSHASEVVVMTAGNIGGAPRFDDETADQLRAASRLYSETMARLAQEESFYFINLYEDPATDLFVQKPEVYIAKDGLHPSSAGYALWYNKLKPVLDRLLTQ